MDNNELKKLNRLELLEILLEQSKRIEELETKVSSLNDEIKARKISISNTGSLAEASLKITEIFKEADEAATIYKNNVIAESKKQEKQLKKELKELKEKKIAEIEAKCQQLEKQTEKKVKVLEEKAKELEEKNTKLKEATKKVPSPKKVSQSKAKTSKRKFK